MKKETKREVGRVWSLTLPSLVILVVPGEPLPAFVPIPAIENFPEQRYQIYCIFTSTLALKLSIPVMLADRRRKSTAFSLT